MFTGAKYARSGDVNIAYQVEGDGPIDLVLVFGWVSHLAYVWELPGMAAFLKCLSSFSRLILFDKRGCGMSDRVHPLPTLEQRMDDVRAVMDAVGSAKAAVMGISEGGVMSCLFAATYPERTAGIIIDGSYPSALRRPGYPWGMTEETQQHNSARRPSPLECAATRNERQRTHWNESCSNFKTASRHPWAMSTDGSFPSRPCQFPIGTG